MLVGVIGYYYMLVDVIRSQYVLLSGIKCY